MAVSLEYHVAFKPGNVQVFSETNHEPIGAHHSCLLQVEELNLDNVCASQVSGLLEQFTSLKRLSLINTGLTMLDPFPSLPALQRVSRPLCKLAL